MAHNSSPRNRKRINFAESNQKIRTELRQAELKLKKDLERMEKQSYTTTNNIANHQQVLKHSWRRLEQKRMQDQQSPLGSRKPVRQINSVEDTKRRLMFANRTALSFETSAESSEYGSPSGLRRPFTHASNRDDLSSTGSLPHLQQQHNAGGNGSPLLHMQRSPFISSPYAFRRTAHQTGTLLPSSSRAQGRVSQHPLAQMQAKQTSADNDDAGVVINGSNECRTSSDTELTNGSDLKLPPLDASMNTRSKKLNLSSKTVDKTIMLKAREFLSMDSGSHGPNLFAKFYDTPANTSSTSLRPVPKLDDFEGMTEEDFLDSLTEEEQEQLKTAKEEVYIVMSQTHSGINY